MGEGETNAAPDATADSGEREVVKSKGAMLAQNEAVSRAPERPERPPPKDITQDDITRALRDPKELRALIARLSPIVQSRVARVVLRNRSRSRGGNVQQEVEDLTQDVFERLFARGGQVLRAWHPERGLSAASFVGLIAERTAISTLRSPVRNPRGEAPTEPAELEYHQEREPAPDKALSAQQATRTLFERLRTSLSPLGFQVFVCLFCEDKSIEAVSDELGLSPEAIYTWRHRIRKTALDLSRDLRDDTGVREAVR